MIPDVLYRKEINPYIEHHLKELHRKYPDLDVSLVNDLRSSMQMIAGYAAAAGYDAGRHSCFRKDKRPAAKAERR